MTQRGTLEHTYVAALRHDLADVTPGATLVGVVRRPTGWFHAAVDENVPALGPPEALLEEFQTRVEDLKRQGLCDEGAHNAVWDEVDFDARYRSHLAQDGADALAALRDRLDDGEDLALVCFENTEQKRCHRTVLVDRLRDEG